MSDWYFSTLATGGDVTAFDYSPPYAQRGWYADPELFQPAPGAVNVPTGTPVNITLGEPVFRGTGKIYLIGKVREELMTGDG